jgi:MFS family permease
MGLTSFMAITGFLKSMLRLFARIRSSFDLQDRNYRLSLYNGWLAAWGGAFFNATIVLASFATRLGANNTLIGLLPALGAAGGSLPQAFLASYVSRLPRKIILYRRVALLRLSGLLILAGSAFCLAGHPSLLLLALFFGLGINAFFTGFSSLAFWGTLAKVIPPSALGRLIGWRNLGGGLLAFFAGFLIRLLLSSSLGFPRSYGVIFLLGALLQGLAWYTFSQIAEPPEPGTPTAISLKLPLLNPQFRSFLLARLLQSLAALVEPFYAVYAAKVLNLNQVGLFLIVFTLAEILSNLLWIRLLTRRSSIYVFQIGALLALVAPLIALLLPPALFAGVFIFQGAYTAVFNLAPSTYLLELAPPEARSSYIGLLNTLTGILAFAPILGGLVADLLGFPALFLIASLLYGLCLAATRILKPALHAA